MWNLKILILKKNNNQLIICAWPVFHIFSGFILLNKLFKIISHFLCTLVTVEMKKKDIAEKYDYKDINFANESEKEFVKILDFYGIKWFYEPKTFPIEWGSDGKPIVSFTPDFYLPEYDLYIELTTLIQKLITRKNKKLKMLKDFYPDINIKLFYKKDYQNLLFSKQINK